MSMNTFGEIFRITTFGESHGPAVGVVVDGVKPGLAFSRDEIQRELDRRRPGGSPVSTSRNEADSVEILSGIFEGKTTGAPILLLVRNENHRSRDYEKLKELFRPGHADFAWLAKYGIRDWRGGGRSSGRETLSRVAAGAIARRLLAERGVEIYAHVVKVGEIEATTFSRDEIERNPVRAADAVAARAMQKAIEDARTEGDSLGGVVEIVATGVPAGWGDPVFFKLDALLGAALLSIGAVKAVEIGDGFSLAAKRGSESNDALTPDGFSSNHMGGTLGGISSGAPLRMRIAVKPTSSIAKPQNTVDTHNAPRVIEVGGRHDPCICPRIVPVAEAMVALVLADAFLRQEALQEHAATPAQAAAELAFWDAELARVVSRREDVKRSIAADSNAHALAAALAESANVRRDQFVAAGLAPQPLEELLSRLDRPTFG